MEGGGEEELILYVAKALVDEPEAVKLHAREDEGLIVYELQVAANDVGKVIGRDGRTARALRTLVTAASAKRRQRAMLQIVE